MEKIKGRKYVFVLDYVDGRVYRYDVWLDINTNHILKMTYSKYGLWEYKLKQVIYSK